ncbi:hypothetical protein K0U83_01075 [bacterium]|nr:hypothetical protein [bacterium]
MSQFDPFQGFQVTVSSSGTAVALNPQPYGNTNTILVYNGTANNVFLRWQTNNNAITGANGVRVPPSGSVQLGVGPLSQRPSSGAATLRIDASSGSTTVEVTYINGNVY